MNNYIVGTHSFTHCLRSELKLGCIISPHFSKGQREFLDLASHTHLPSLLHTQATIQAPEWEEHMVRADAGVASRITFNAYVQRRVTTF